MFPIFRYTITLLTTLLCGFEVCFASEPANSGFNLIVVGDPQPQTEEQISRLELELLPRIRQVVEEYQTTSELPVAILLTGDVVWDTMEFLPRVKADFEALGVPVYAVIGNHDHDRSVVGNEPLAEEPFEATFGSRYYSFELGQTLFVALDNIDYTSYDEYDLGVSREQLRWLRRLMRQTPKNQRVAVAMHAPVCNRREGEVIPYAKRIMRIVGNRELHFITGHSHRHATNDISSTVVEHGVAQLSGNLWFAPICADGTPQGVFCIEERDGAWQWHHQRLDTESNEPLVAWPTGRVEGYEEYVVVKVVGWDKRWSVECRESGGESVAMEPITIADPDYVQYVEHEADYEPIIMERLRRSALPASHYFCYRPSSENSQIIITATDRFGREFTIVVE